MDKRRLELENKLEEVEEILKIQIKEELKEELRAREEDELEEEKT